MEDGRGGKGEGRRERNPERKTGTALRYISVSLRFAYNCNE
jgi:hypothetical protein